MTSEERGIYFFFQNPPENNFIILNFLKFGQHLCTVDCVDTDAFLKCVDRFIVSVFLDFNSKGGQKKKKKSVV